MTQRTMAEHPPRRSRHRHRLGAGAAAIAALAIGGTAIIATPALAAGEPDFGPNVTIFDESWSVDDINAALMGASQEAEFSQNRHQFFFAPGTYGSAAGEDDPLNATGIVNSELGYYQAVAGLGASPEDVRINGAIHVEPVRQCEPNPWDCQQPGSLTRFWRSLSNVSINPIQRPVGIDADRPFPSGVTEPHMMRFAVSQAAPLRRVDIEGDLTLFGRVGEYASGGYLANSNVDGRIITGSQQQWFTRNSTVGTWDGGVWNMVFSGVDGAPAHDFGPKPDGTTGNKTVIAQTPINRESPFLYLDGDEYRVFVPKAKADTSGHDWSTDASAGDSIAIGDFFIAKEGDTAAELNAALAGGKHLLVTPGVYHLDEPLAVDRAGTVVLGLGYASLVPDAGTAAIEVGDVSGVKIAGLTVDAGLENSDVLVRVGPDGASVADAADPTTLTDVFIRVGGPWAGKATTSIEVNSPHVLLDHIWAWRADHGAGVAWDSNTGDHGVIVNGDDVTALGLFVEHYQENQVIWNGERGRTIFYQSEIPYDPPTQAAYMDGDRLGFASYRVGDQVASHLAQGLGVYSFFDQTINGGQDIRVESGIQAPKSAGVRFESMTSVFLNGTGGINRIINDAGAPAVGSFASPQLVSYPPADTTAPTVAIASNPAAPGADGTYAGAVTLTITGADDFTPPPTLEANVDGAGWQAVTAPIELGDGTHTVLVRATDAAGNVSAEASWTGTIAIVVVPDVPLDAAAHTQCLDGRAYVVVSATNRAALAADIRLTSSEGTVKFTKVAPGETVTYLWKAGKRVDAGTATVAGYTWSDGQGKYSTYRPAYDARSCK
ncbi:adenylyl cyclase [Agromyces agglutinans]|uniref:adenylyl cyclase n=1 Tax=Agromyces agglutinans TaxID=2662258 RepID=UPI001C12CEF2|nr:adenylyl cyclase [Agromyces agglutinans]